MNITSFIERNYKNLCNPAKLYLFIFVFCIIILFINNLGNYSSFYIGTMNFTLVQFIILILIKILYAFIWIWILQKICSLKYTNLSWFLVLFPYILVFISSIFIYNKKLLTNNIKFNYNKKEATIFKHELQNINKNDSDINAYSQVTIIPLYCNNKLIGNVYSDAKIFENNSSNISVVVQTLIYIFNGNHNNFPKGSLVVRIFFENNKKNIFPPNDVYIAHIISGSDAYINATGTVTIDVNDDERNAIINFTHI